MGTLLYEMLHGLPPFYSQNVAEMYEKIQNERLVFPKHFQPHTLDYILADTLMFKSEPGVYVVDPDFAHSNRIEDRRANLNLIFSDTICDVRAASGRCVMRVLLPAA